MSARQDGAAPADDPLAWIDSVAAGAAVSPAAVARLCEFLADSRKAVQRRAAEVLGDVGGRGGEVEAILGRMLAEAPPRGRWGAAFALGRLDALPEQALPVLIAALASPDGDVRWAACDMLVRRSHRWRQVAVDALLDLAREGDPRQRKMALYALRDLEHRGAAGVQAALLGLAAADSDLRLAAMAALVRLSDDRVAAARTVAALLTDADVRVRRAAAGTLGTLACGDVAIRDALVAARDDPDRSTARAARSALARLPS